MADEVVQGGTPEPRPTESLESRLTGSTGGTEISSPSPEPIASPAAVPGNVPDSLPPATPQTQGTPEAAQWQGVRDYARAQGIELPWQDDVEALRNLLTNYSERNFYADLGRQIAPHAQQFQEYIAKQQTPAPVTPPAYQPPPFKREWLQMVEQDPNTGMLRSKPGYDPSLPEKVQAYSDWRDKFLQEPESVMAPMVEERARAIVREEQANYQEQNLAQQLVNREAPWMFEGGVPGTRLTPAGQMYGRAAAQLYESGLRDVRQMHAAAVAMVQNAFYRQQYTQAQRQAQTAAGAAAGTGQVPAPAELPVSLGGALTRPGSSAPRQPQQSTQKNMSLRERLMVRFDQAGIPENTGFSGT